MKQTPKIWGSTCKLFDRNNVEVHRIQVKDGGFCSKHWHKYKFNLFYVESGRLWIRQWLANGDSSDIALVPGESLTVRPGVLHRFEALEDTVAYEIYWAELDDDIYRESQGGIKAEAEVDAAMREIGAIMAGANV